MRILNKCDFIDEILKRCDIMNEYWRGVIFSTNVEEKKGAMKMFWTKVAHKPNWILAAEVDHPHFVTSWDGGKLVYNMTIGRLYGGRGKAG